MLALATKTQLVKLPSPSELRLKLVFTMAELFKTLGYTDVRALAVGYPQPMEMMGTTENHTPDVTARQNDARRTGIILDCLTPSHFRNMDRFKSRLALFRSASNAFRAELHFAIFNVKLKDVGLMEDALRARLKLYGVTANKIWAL